MSKKVIKMWIHGKYNRRCQVYNDISKYLKKKIPENDR